MGEMISNIPEITINVNTMVQKDWKAEMEKRYTRETLGKSKLVCNYISIRRHRI